MRETENERRFKRDMILGRVVLHLRQRLDRTLPRRELWAIEDAEALVGELRLSTLIDDMKPGGAE